MIWEVDDMRGSVSSGVMRSSTLVVFCAAPENKIRSSMLLWQALCNHYFISVRAVYCKCNFMESKKHRGTRDGRFLTWVGGVGREYCTCTCPIKEWVWLTCNDINIAWWKAQARSQKMSGETAQKWSNKGQHGILCIKYLRRSVITQNEEKKKKKRHRQNRGLYS